MFYVCHVLIKHESESALGVCAFLCDRAVRTNVSLQELMFYFQPPNISRFANFSVSLHVGNIFPFFFFPLSFLPHLVMANSYLTDLIT